MLDILVHASGTVRRRHAYIEIRIPAEVEVEKITPDNLPGWDSASYEMSRNFGDRWTEERRTAVLLVPSVVTRVERNVLINQDHPGFTLIRAGSPDAGPPETPGSGSGDKRRPPCGGGSA